MTAFEVEHVDPAVPGGWALVGIAEGRSGAAAMVADWAACLRLPPGAFRIRRHRPRALTPERVAELVAQYQAHWVSPRDPRLCGACSARFPCHWRVDARDQLVAGGATAALWVT